MNCQPHVKENDHEDDRISSGCPLGSHRFCRVRERLRCKDVLRSAGSPAQLTNTMISKTVVRERRHSHGPLGTIHFRRTVNMKARNREFFTPAFLATAIPAT